MDEELDLSSVVIVLLTYVIPVLITEIRKFFQRKKESELIDRVTTLETEMAQLRADLDKLRRVRKPTRVK